MVRPIGEFVSPFRSTSRGGVRTALLQWGGETLATKENSCSACCYQLQDLTRLFMDWPASAPFWFAVFALLLSLISGPNLGRGTTVGSSWNSSALPSLGSGQILAPPTVCFVMWLANCSIHLLQVVVKANVNETAEPSSPETSFVTFPQKRRLMSKICLVQ